jgi:hypothetical protein
MSMRELIEQGIVRQIPPNNARAKSLIIMSKQTMVTILSLKLSEQNASIIFRELYECLRQAIEAIGYMKGYKFENHESLRTFIEEELENKTLPKDFDRYRKIRNGINYYGDVVSIETVADAIRDIPKYIKEVSEK